MGMSIDVISHVGNLSAALEWLTNDGESPSLPTSLESDGESSAAAIVEDVSKLYKGKLHYRLWATRDIPERGVRKGDLGGWAHPSAKITGNGWVADNAIASVESEISGNALVKDFAIVGKKARVTDDAIISDNAHLDQGAEVSGNARISGNAEVGRRAKISENAQIIDRAIIGNRAIIDGRAVICDRAIVGHNAQIGGTAWIDKKSIIKPYKKIRKGQWSVETNPANIWI